MICDHNYLKTDQLHSFHEQADSLTGFRVANIPIRDYKKSNLAYSHLFGYVGKIKVDVVQSGLMVKE